VSETFIEQIKHREQADSMGFIVKDLPQAGDNINILEGLF